MHVSKVEDGAAPSPEDLRVYADQIRDRTRNFNWLRPDVEVLNQQLIVAALQERLNNLASDIKQATDDISELEKLVIQAQSNPSVLKGVPLEDIQEALNEAQDKLLKLKELQTTLPEQLKAAQTPAGS